MLRHLLPFPALAAGTSALALAQVVGEERGAAVAAVALVGTLALAGAPRRPLMAVVAAAGSVAGQVLLLPGDPVFGSFVALIAGFYALGRRAHGRDVALGAAATVAVVAVLLLRDARPTSPAELVFPLVYFGGAFGLGRLVRRQQREAAAALEASRREAAAREQVALAEERARIAREMHDVVAHSVSLLVVQAEAAAAVLPTDPARAAAQVDRVADSGREALLELRRLLGLLRTDAPAGAPVDAPVEGVGPQPTLAALPGLAEPLRDAGRRVDLEVADGLGDVPPGLQLTAYRVVQEALTNAVRHGSAQRMSVRVHRCGDELVVEVCDDGTAGPASPPGHGLTGMRERLRVYGGRLEAGPQDGGGWRVSARAPVAQP